MTTIVENTWRFAESGEVLAWEFYAERLRPVKLIVLRALDKGKRFELLGESETVIPKKIGINHFVLREPIPVEPRDYFGFIQPEEQAIPFKKSAKLEGTGHTQTLPASLHAAPTFRQLRMALFGTRTLSAKRR